MICGLLQTFVNWLFGVYFKGDRCTKKTPYRSSIVAMLRTGGMERQISMALAVATGMHGYALSVDSRRL